MPVYDKPITLQKIDENTEKWGDYLKLHASVNKTRQSAYLGAGASQSRNTLTFEVRWCPPLKQVERYAQLYRILYDGAVYKIIETDDFERSHLTFKMVAEFYAD